MVKLDLDINEIVGLAEQGRIGEKKLKKFLKVATKDELEDYIVSNTLEGEEDNPETLEEAPEPEEPVDDPEDI